MNTLRSILHAPRLWLWVAIFLLWLIFAQTARTAARTSLTTDEGLHITSGYSILRTGDYRLVEEHPPLVKLLAALPLLPVRDLPDPRTLPGWKSNAGETDTVQLVRVMKQWLQPYRPFERVVYAARVPIMLLSLLLGAIIYRWASDLAGSRAGLVALGLYAFDPNMLAHSSVAAIDLGATAFITFATYTFWRALRRPTRVNVTLAGIMLGLAQAAKISALILLPLFIALMILRALTAHDLALLSSLHVRRWVRATGRGQMLVRLGFVLCVMFILAGVTLWAIYGFELRTPPGWRISIPAASHLIPLERVRTDLVTGRTTFLMGQLSDRGWRYYFPVAFAIKTPLPTLLLLLAAIISCISGLARTRQWGEWNILTLATFPLVYSAAAIVQPFNIGYRHLLPILPFMFIFIGTQISKGEGQIQLIQFVTPSLRSGQALSEATLAPALARSAHLPWRCAPAQVPGSAGEGLDPTRPKVLRALRALRMTVVTPFSKLGTTRERTKPQTALSRFKVWHLMLGVLGLWYVIGTVSIFPDYLAYFNELVGGPDGGYHYLVDSNLDWGQAWKELRAYMDAHGTARVKFSQGTSNDPATYGIDYEPIAPMKGAPPVLPARFNPAPGAYVLSPTSLQGVALADINMYDYFRHRLPMARIGHALFVYDVQPTEPLPGWVAMCVAPAPLMEPHDVVAGFGRTDLRLVYFDCSQAWVIPGNAAIGWVVAPYATAHDQDSFVRRWIDLASLTFEQKQPFALPPHSIFITSGQGIMSKLVGLHSLSATFGAVAELLGYKLDQTAARPGQSLELLTLWRVTGRPTEALSLMAHLVGPDARVVANGDGLGVPAENWQAGDLIVQKNMLTVPGNTPPGAYQVEMGLYTLSDLHRLDVVQGGAKVGDQLPLVPVEVKP